MNVRPQFGELFIDHGESDRSLIHLYISNPSPLEERNLGRVFAILEFTEPEPFVEDIIEHLDSTFTHGYYHSSDFDVEAAFERALHKVNKFVQETVGQRGENWVYNVNALLGVMRGTEVHVAYVGSMEAFLIQGEDIIDIVQKTKSEEIKPLKLFTNIISGECAEKNSLILSTSNLLDYLSLEKIRRTIIDSSPDDVIARFENILTEQTTLSNIAALVISPQIVSATAMTVEDEDTGLSRADDPIERTAFTNNEDSMDRLIDQERTTVELLTPSIWPSLKKRITNVVGPKTDERDAQVERTSPNYKKSENQFLNVLLLIGKFLKNLGTQIVIGLVFLSKQLYKLVKNDSSISSGIGNSVSGVKGWWQRLSTPQRIFLLLAVTVLLIFVISLFWRDRSVDKQTQTTEITNALNQVENLLGEIESKKIMNDEAGVRSAVNQADTVLATVPTDSEEYVARGITLRDQINVLQNEFNKVTTVNAEPIANFADSGLTDPVRITKIGDNIFAFSGGSNSVTRANLANQQTTSVISGTSSTEAYTTVDNDSAATTLVAIANNTVAQFNPVLEKTSPVNITLDSSEQITDFDVFGSRLYVLDAANKTIYRHDKSGDVYGSAKEWLTEPVDLSTAVDLDIDGSIYVLSNTGTIRQFDGGTETALTVEELNPSLAGASRLVKPDPASSFYILNPTTQRLVKLSANAELEQQFTSDQFTNLRDVVIDEEAQVAYVLNGTELIRIPLQ